VFVLTGCGSSEKSKRDAANAYLGRVQEIQQDFQPSFDLANQAYRQNLSGSKTATAQANALDGYSTAVRKVVVRFRSLAPPSALRPWQRAQVLRLQQIVDSGHTLATALRVRDRNATTALIKRFRFLLSHQPNVSQGQHNAVKAYDNRLVGISKLQGTIAGSINAFRTSSARTG
jgi:hypothetical protein